MRLNFTHNWVSVNIYLELATSMNRKEAMNSNDAAIVPAATPSVASLATRMFS